MIALQHLGGLAQEVRWFFSSLERGHCMGRVLQISVARVHAIIWVSTVLRVHVSSSYLGGERQANSI